MDWQQAHHRYFVRCWTAPDGERPTAENTTERGAMLSTRLPGYLEPLRLPSVRLYPPGHPDYPYVTHERDER
jgi:hypothetical protein